MIRKRKLIKNKLKVKRSSSDFYKLVKEVSEKYSKALKELA